MFSSRTTSIRRGRALLAATMMLLATAVIGPAAASADTVSMSLIDDDPTVGVEADINVIARAYSYASVSVYAELGATSCPSSANSAYSAGMTFVDSATLSPDGSAGGGRFSYEAPAAGAVLFCGYVQRTGASPSGTTSMVVNFQDPADSPTVTVASSQALTTSNTVTAVVSCPRACSLLIGGTASSSTSGTSVTLGTVATGFGTFGGSVTVRLPMTSMERRRLRLRLEAGELVQARLTATASYPELEAEYATSATTALVLSAGPIPGPTLAFRGV